jgi:hypothetical protein
MQDEKPTYVVATGGLLCGFEIHGPFQTTDEAERWYRKTIFGLTGQAVSIIALLPPDEAIRQKDLGDE